MEGAQVLAKVTESNPASFPTRLKILWLPFETG
jgi:hypothetical protein